MHLGIEELASYFETHRHEPHLVLATVVATEGSTYRKPGAMLLTAPGGSHAGLISGGCLEGDLVRHAAAVFASGEPRRLSYDLHDDPELIMGLGLGCGGAIHLLLQRLDRAAGFSVLPQLFAAHRRGLDCVLALLPEASGALPAGTMAVQDTSGEFAGPPELQPVVAMALNDRSGVQRWRVTETHVRGATVQANLLWLAAPPQVLICGAGPDAVPLAAQVRGLGWRCTVVDHRASMARAERFAAGTAVHCLRPGALAGTVDPAAVDAAVVMTHHLGHDEAYLRALLGRGPAYVGLLGPDRRRRQLAAAIGANPNSIRGPAGLDLGAELPASIALAVMAEIHAVLNGRDARPLTADD